MREDGCTADCGSSATNLGNTNAMLGPVVSDPHHSCRLRALLHSATNTEVKPPVSPLGQV